MEQTENAEYAKLFKVLSDETRLNILRMLSDKTMIGVDIMKQIDVGQSTLSYHLKLLQEAGFVKGKADWRSVFYSVSDEGKKTIDKFFEKLKK
jgi:ArsR family transcriptional regulator